MRVTARVENRRHQHRATVQTGDAVQALDLQPKASGFGSRTSGGELLFLALATCYCNDVYREAAKRGITVTRVHVEVEGDFEAEGQPATNMTYRVTAEAEGDPEAVRTLLEHTDRVAEIQNTLRAPTPVTLEQIVVQPPVAAR
jgi:uncharacterized OsmC-like protein